MLQSSTGASLVTHGWHGGQADDCLQHPSLMFSWVRRAFRGRRSPNGHELFNALSEREQQILLREMADSSRNAMPSPSSSVGTGDSILDKSASLNLNPAIRGGSIGNVGVPAQSLDETRQG